MSVARILPTGGANDFNVAIAGTYTSVTFDKEYSPGAYTMTSALNDSTYDIYLVNADGTGAGYSKTPSIVATKGFIKMIILGGTANDLLSFTYKTTYNSADDSDEVAAGPVAASVSPSSMPNIDDTTVLTGRNFAANATVTFTSANTAYTPTAAKNVVRTSATSLIVTRPDNMTTAYSPYGVRVENPGVSNPTGTNSHILSNVITAGTNPAWQTGTTLPEVNIFGSAYSTTLLATDTEASDIDYTLISGTLPTGLSLNQETGVISGAYSGSEFSNSITVRATDAGGNYLDRTFTIFGSLPVWVTGATLTGGYNGGSYSVQLSATDNSSITYSVSSGSLPSGLSLSSSGLLSGTITAANTATPYSFTLRVSDAVGNRADRTFNMTINLNEAPMANNANGTPQGSWGYNGGNTDAYSFTLSGGNISLASLSVWNTTNGSPYTISGTAAIYLFAGGSTNGTILASASISGTVIAGGGTTSGGGGAGITKLNFSSPVSLTSGNTYTVAIGWSSAQSGLNTYTSAGFNSPTVAGRTFSISSASINGAGFLGSSNGTASNSQGQIPKLFFINA